MAFRPDRAFNDLPALPPAQDIETTAVLKACIYAPTRNGGANHAVLVPTIGALSRPNLLASNIAMDCNAFGDHQTG
ncbi:hypothetical protein AB3G45_28475 [Shinella sp. S4-D37]|uniref:hypothetical protein n=1 Tax=Shinella sp. S4-D37 TaxID=3161999 RepID=UPI0034672438